MRVLVIVLALLSVAGVISLGFMWTQPTWQWGYMAAMVSFLVSAGGTAPVLSMSSRVGRGYWGARLRRMADVLGLATVVSAPLMIVVLTRLPDWRGRDSIWFDWPGAPLIWDSVAAIGLAIASVALVWVVSWPERGGGQWAGTPTQWRVLTRGIVTLGALYTMLVVFMHLLISSDLALSLVPGWHSAVIAPYHAVSGFEAGVALVVVGLAAVGQLDARISRSCAKLLLGMGLLWFYFVWCELLTNWYGRTPDEQAVLELFMFGPGAGLFLVSTVGAFLVPLCVLVWNGARGSPMVVTIVSVIVVTGSFADRLRLFVGAWTVAAPTPTDHLPDVLPSLPFPTALDIVACAGILALAGLVVVLTLDKIKPVADWEVKAVERLTPERRVLRTRSVVVARPS